MDSRERIQIGVVTPAFDATESRPFCKALARLLELLEWAAVTVYTTEVKGAPDFGRDGKWEVRRFPLEAADAVHQQLGREMRGRALSPSEGRRWIDSAARSPQLVAALRESRHSAYLLTPCRSPLVFKAGQVHPGRSILLADLQEKPRVPLEQ